MPPQVLVVYDERTLSETVSGSVTQRPRRVFERPGLALLQMGSSESEALHLHFPQVLQMTIVHSECKSICGREKPQRTGISKKG